MRAIDVEPFLAWFREDLEPALRPDGPGAYARRVGGPVDLYAMGDLAVVLWSIDRLPRAEHRAAWVERFGDFQDPLSGHFVEHGKATHVELHVTAYAVAALELLDAVPPARLRFADDWRRSASMVEQVEALDWSTNAYLTSHTVAGIGSIMANNRALRSQSWFEAWFGVLDSHLDARTGLHGDAQPRTGSLDGVGATFHYAFCHEHFHRALAHGEARIDAVLGLQLDDGSWDPDNPWWMTLDAIYLLSRAARTTDHRRAEVLDAVHRAVAYVAAEGLAEYARATVFAEDHQGTHNLAAVISLLAEAQGLLGSDVVRTEWPLRLALDRRPFL